MIVLGTERQGGRFSGDTIWAFESTGAVENSKGLVGELYSYIARITRGNVWITEALHLGTPD